MTQSEWPIVRGGRRKPENLYVQHGTEATDADPGLGYIHDRDTAERMVAAYNAVRRAHEGERVLLHPYAVGTSLRSTVLLVPAYLCQVCAEHVPASDLSVDSDGDLVDMCRACADQEPAYPEPDRS